MGAPPWLRRGKRPRGELPLDPVGVGQVGLEDDARAERQELRLIQYLLERRHREVQVAVLLHVEVDELRRDAPVGMPVAVARGLAVERAEPLGDPPHRRAEGDEVDLAEDRRDLHRDVFHVVAGEQREVCGQAPRRLRLAQDRLAELVEVEPHPRPAPLLEVTPEVLFLAREDDVLRLVAESVHDGRHHQAREVVRHRPAQHERGALPPVHVLGHAVTIEEIGELVGDALGAVTPEGLIRQRDGQLLAVRIGHHAGELAGLGALFGGLLGARLAEERLGELDGAPLGAPVVGRPRPHGRPPVYGGSRAQGRRCARGPRAGCPAGAARRVSDILDAS